MNLKEKVKIIQEELDRLYPDVKPPLPFFSPFTLLVSAVLSANSTDKVAGRVASQLFEIAWEPIHFANMNEKELIDIIKPCGLAPTKAKNIIAFSKIIIEKFGGEVPSTIEELMSLPGVGHKIASVVLIQGFKKKAFPVDTHIKRLAHRWGLSKEKSPEKISEDLKRLFPEDKWGKIHLQMIYYGREYCRARGHQINQCPICYKLNAQENKM